VLLTVSHQLVTTPGDPSGCLRYSFNKPSSPWRTRKPTSDTNQYSPSKIELHRSSNQSDELDNEPKTRFLVSFAGLPAWISNAGISLVTTLPAVATACSPMVTPGQTTARAPTHDPSHRTMGPTISPNCGSSQSWFPVQRYAPCDMQQFDPIEISPRSSSQTLSPIQE
jgi:hypothetical protein